MVPLGTVTLDCTSENGHKENPWFYVTSSTCVPILSSKACNDMNLVKRVYACQPRQRSSMTKEEMKQNYKNVSTGVGQYEKRYHMQLNQNVEGVIQPPQIPYATQPKLKVVLDKLNDQNIIADVDKPTEWFSTLVIVEKKPGALRLCLDPRPLNVAIKRERHVIPTPADVQAQLSGENVFTVVDMKDGYWHVKLSDESSYFCTFNTPWGRKRFLWMPICQRDIAEEKRRDIWSLQQQMTRSTTSSWTDCCSEHVTKESSSTVTKFNSRSVRSNTRATLFHLRAWNQTPRR